MIIDLQSWNVHWFAHHFDMFYIKYLCATVNVNYKLKETGPNW